MRKILILAANPKNTAPLRLDEELREIDAGLRRAKQRDQFELVQKLAVRTRDIQRAMLDETPQIVHFSGHGEGTEGLVFENEQGEAALVTGAALAGLFELFADPDEFLQPIQCVVLNGCYSQVQAEAIAAHVPYVIGMARAIGDRAAIEFAVGFYDALGAGRSVKSAFKFGCSAIRLAGIAEHLTPILVEGPDPTTARTESLQSDPAVLPTPSFTGVGGDLATRNQLFNDLTQLPLPQFEQFLFSLSVPPGMMSSRDAPQGKRVSEFLDWVDAPSSTYDLDQLERLLKEYIESLRERP